MTILSATKAHEESSHLLHMHAEGGIARQHQDTQAHDQKGN